LRVKTSCVTKSPITLIVM